MKKYLLTAILMLCLFNNAHADFYIGVLGGVNLMDVEKIDDFKLDMKTGYTVGGALGYRSSPCSPMRVEAEVAYRCNGLDTGKYDFSQFDSSASVSASVDTLTCMANGYYDIKTGCRLTPYIGGGIGYARRSIKANASVEGETPLSVTARLHRDDFAYQGIAGVSYALCADVDVGVEYRYFNTLDSKANEHFIGLAIKRYF